QSLFILHLCILTENQFRVGRAVKPSVLLDLLLKLSRRPSGVPKRKDGARRSFTSSDRLENVERSRKADAFVDGQCGILDKEIGRVQHEATPGLDRAALKNLHIAGAGRQLDPLGGWNHLKLY